MAVRIDRRRVWCLLAATLLALPVSALREVDFERRRGRDGRAHGPLRGRQDDAARCPRPDDPAGLGPPPAAWVEVTGDERRRARSRNEFFGYVHQDLAIVDDETVEQNVTISLEYASPRVRRNAGAWATMSPVGLGWAVYKKASHLSGGEHQWVAIARSLVTEPDLVLADEPTSALDSVIAEEILTLLLAARERGASVLMAAHDPRVADRWDRIVPVEQV